MIEFDKCIDQIDAYVKEMRETGNRYRELFSTTCFEDLAHSLPFKVGPGAGSGLVLKSDAFLELGSPTAGSCAFTLYSDTSPFNHASWIRLIGPDVQECPSCTLPFGQVIIARGEVLTDKEYQDIIQSQYTMDQIEGYMVKSSPGHIWSRVSNDVAKKGFSFEFLGMALIKLLKMQIQKVTSVEVIFVTSGKADVQRLCEIEVEVKKIVRELKRRFWGAKGIDISECAFGGHCGECEYKPVCDKIIKVKYARQ